MQIIGEKKILNVLIFSTLNAAMAQLIEQLLVVQKNRVQIPYIPLLFSMQKRSLEIIEVINKVLLDLPWPSGNSHCFYMEGWGSNPTPSLFFHAGKKFIKTVVMSKILYVPLWPSGQSSCLLSGRLGFKSCLVLPFFPCRMRSNTNRTQDSYLTSDSMAEW